MRYETAVRYEAYIEGYHAGEYGSRALAVQAVRESHKDGYVVVVYRTHNKYGTEGRRAVWQRKGERES